jgi:hypothetical protein
VTVAVGVAVGVAVEPWVGVTVSVGIGTIILSTTGAIALPEADIHSPFKSKFKL